MVTAIPSAGGRAQLTYGNQNWNSSLTGTTQDFPSVRNYQLASGQFFTSGSGSGSSVINNVTGTGGDVQQTHTGPRTDGVEQRVGRLHRQRAEGSGVVLGGALPPGVFELLKRVCVEWLSGAHRATIVG